MKKTILSIGLAILMLSGSAIAALDKYFYSSGQILPGEEWENVYVYNDITVVDMNGGLVDSIGAYNASTVNITGGRAYNVETWGNGYINVSGGTVGGLTARINGTITFSDNALSSTLGAVDFGKVIMTGGTTHLLGANDSGIIDLCGGLITESLGAWGSSVVNIYGHDFIYNPTGGLLDGGQLRGFYLNDVEFTIDLTGSQTYSHINLIPEPSSLLLLGFGALILRRKR